jgi:hypothetical protein
MKKILVLLSISCIFLLVFASSSCKKDNSPKDTTIPVITLIGSSPMYVAKDSTFNDPGATALDETDGDITSRIEKISLVETSVEGTYYVRYNVSDNAGNKATEVVRTVIVTIF